MPKIQPRKKHPELFNIQHFDTDVKLSDQEKINIYYNLKKRVVKKSGHAYFDRSERPILLRLFFKGSLFNSTQEFLVVYGSFKIVYSNDNNNKELGFEVTLRTFDDVKYKLNVFKNQFTASMIEIIE